MIDVPVYVKEALKDGRLRKNYRILVLNDDGTTDFVIDNNNLVSETVDIDERMCSGDTIKFGLCEGSSIEFQYFEKPNITDRQIKVFCDAYYDSSSYYSIPMGYFTVKKCSRQASTGIIKATAYNKLQSDYLDAKANNLLIESFVSDRNVNMYDIRYFLLNDYQIAESREEATKATYQQVIPANYISLGTFGFTQNYGIKSPINPREMGGTSNFVLQLVSVHVNYNVQTLAEPTMMIDARFGTLSRLEENLVNFIKKTIDDAKLTVSGQSVINYICANGGFNRVLSVTHIYYKQEGGQIIAVVDKFSTVQWDYEEKNNIAHTVQGRITDIQPLNRGGSYLVYVPREIVDGSLDPVVPFGGGGTYEYYLDSSMTTYGTEEQPFLTFSDMTRYEYYNLSEDIYAIVPWIYSGLSSADKINVTVSSLPDFTLREITTAIYETTCQFGQLDRETDLFFGAELNHSRLYPAENLYPANDLYPDGAALSSERSMYSKLWGDEGNIQKWRYLIITYKGLDENNKETEYKLQRTVNADGTQDYNMSDNWLFKNLVWTAAQIGDYADAMVAKMRDITWFPFEMWCAGLPYLETGDEIEITLSETTYTSYILQRQLKGIQNLQDTYINGTLDIF